MLAESLILSGMAMAVAGSSRPGSGGEHEIMHAINQLYPGTGSHGELAGVGTVFCTYLRGDLEQAEVIAACLHRHGLPRTPAELGLPDADFAAAVRYAPQTRPGRYTILERLELSEAEIASRVAERYLPVRRASLLADHIQDELVFQAMTLPYWAVGFPSP